MDNHVTATVHSTLSWKKNTRNDSRADSNELTRNGIDNRFAQLESGVKVTNTRRQSHDLSHVFVFGLNSKIKRGFSVFVLECGICIGKEHHPGGSSSVAFNCNFMQRSVSGKIFVVRVKLEVVSEILHDRDTAGSVMHHSTPLHHTARVMQTSRWIWRAITGQAQREEERNRGRKTVEDNQRDTEGERVCVRAGERKRLMACAYEREYVPRCPIHAYRHRAELAISQAPDFLQNTHVGSEKN